MSLTDAFVARLEALKVGDLSRLCQLAGQPLDETLQGFDLFTGMWWPLRRASPRAPERCSAWLVAKLYGAFPLLNVRANPMASLPAVLGSAEQREQSKENRDRFRRRFDALLTSPLALMETHLRWTLSVARKAVGQNSETGIDWVRLLDDLSLWERHLNPNDTMHKHRLSRHSHVCQCQSNHVSVQDLWACEYLCRTSCPVL